MNTIQNKERFIVQFMFPSNEFILKEEAYYEDTDRKESMGGSVKPAGFIFTYDYERTRRTNSRYTGEATEASL